jgi:hypothetical protein
MKILLGRTGVWIICVNASERLWADGMGVELETLEWKIGFEEENISRSYQPELSTKIASHDMTTSTC